MTIDPGNHSTWQMQAVQAFTVIVHSYKKYTDAGGTTNRKSRYVPSRMDSNRPHQDAKLPCVALVIVLSWVDSRTCRSAFDACW